jgi:hypothetical protein
MKRLVFPLLILSLALILPALSGCPQESGSGVPNDNQEDDTLGNNPGSGQEDGADSNGSSGGGQKDDSPGGSGKEDDTVPGNIPSGHLGDGPLVLKGKVYTAAVDLGLSVTPYTGSGVVEAVENFGGGENLGEAPLINGEFDISITKKPADLVNISANKFSDWDSPKTDPADARGQYVYLSLQDADSIVEIRKTEIEFSGDPANISGTFKSVSYLYVDKDVVITLGENKILEGSMEMTYKAAALELKKGWNALVREMDISGSGSPSEIVDISRIDLTGSGNVSLSVGNPGFKQWIFLPVTIEGGEESAPMGEPD